MTTRAPGNRRRLLGGLVALLVASVTACQSTPPDRRADAQAFADQVRAMPGVVAAGTDVADSPPQGMVYFRVSVDGADDLSADQLTAIVDRYVQELQTGKYADYRTELDVRHGWNVFAIDSGKPPIANVEQIVQQGRDWIALRYEFPSATVRLRSSSATITLNGGADYTAVAAAARSLSTRYPELAGIDWTINAGKEHPAQIVTSRRLPTDAELDVWNRLNADQTIPHVDRLRINGPVTPPVWISEETTRSRDLTAALALAQRHLPIAASLPAPVLYTASDEISGHIGAKGNARGPVAVTIGGCTPHDPLVYLPIPQEQALLNSYQKCAS